MWIVLAGVAVIAVAVAAVTVFRRPKADDLSSVRSYHSALGTMEQLSDRSARSTADMSGRTARPGQASDALRSSRAPAPPSGSTPGPEPGIGGYPPPAGVVPPVPVRGNQQFPDPERPLVFDDSLPPERVHDQAPAEESAGVRADRAKRHALESMNHRPRRLTSVLIVVAVVVLFGALAYAGSKRSSSGHSHSASATASTVSSPSHPSSSPASDPSHAGSDSGAKATTDSGAESKSTEKGTDKTTSKNTDKARAKTTPTTQPSRIVALTSTSTSATYPVAGNSYQVTVVATGSCWVAATSVSTGSTIWAGDLQAGAVQVIPATGTVTVQLGTPSALLTLDKVPVIFPQPVHSPFVATFRPTAAATPSVGAPSTGSGTTTTSVTATTDPTSP